MVCHRKRFDEFVKLSVQNARQAMGGQSDAVIGQPVPGEVVSADLLASITALYLRPAFLLDFGGLLFLFKGEELGS